MSVLLTLALAAKLAAVVILVLAAAHDIATRLMPNALTYGLWLVGLARIGTEAVIGAITPGEALGDLLVGLVMFRLLYLFWALPEALGQAPVAVIKRGPDLYLLTLFGNFVRTGKLVTSLAIASVLRREAPEPRRSSVPMQGGSFFGGGDVKLLVGAALVVGLPGLFTVVVGTLLFGGLLVVLFAIDRAFGAPPVRHLAYGPAIAIGALLALGGMAL